MTSQINVDMGGGRGVTVIPDFLDPPPQLRPPRSVAKDTAFIALMAIASSTVIEPVIATPIDTVVSVERGGVQNDFLPELRRPVGVASATSSAVLTESYSIDDPSAVEQYLENNSDLVEFLNMISSELTETSGVASVALELYRDSEELWEKLFVVATTTIEDVAELSALEDELFISLFQPSTDVLSGRVVLSVG